MIQPQPDSARILQVTSPQLCRLHLYWTSYYCEKSNVIVLNCTVFHSHKFNTPLFEAVNINTSQHSIVQNVQESCNRHHHNPLWWYNGITWCHSVRCVSVTPRDLASASPDRMNALLQSGAYLAGTYSEEEMGSPGLRLSSRISLPGGGLTTSDLSLPTDLAASCDGPYNRTSETNLREYLRSLQLQRSSEVRGSDTDPPPATPATPATPAPRLMSVMIPSVEPESDSDNAPLDDVSDGVWLRSRPVVAAVWSVWVWTSSVDVFVHVSMVLFSVVFTFPPLCNVNSIHMSSLIANVYF